MQFINGRVIFFLLKNPKSRIGFAIESLTVAGSSVSSPLWQTIPVYVFYPPYMNGSLEYIGARWVTPLCTPLYRREGSRTAHTHLNLSENLSNMLSRESTPSDIKSLSRDPRSSSSVGVDYPIQ